MKKCEDCKYAGEQNEYNDESESIQKARQVFESDGNIFPCFSYHKEEIKNVCRKNTPNLGLEKIGDVSAVCHEGLWPVVDIKKDWCGEYESK